MEGVSMLYQAALDGNVSALLEMIQQDRLILDRVITSCVMETPLHVAAMLGHVDFVQEILNQKAELAKELDSRRSSPLHLASVKGYVEIVEELLVVNPDMCLTPDVEGRNPLHLAVIKGHIDVLKTLIRANPFAVQAKVEGGETILHFCVKHKQLEALKLLLEVMQSHEFVNSKDNYGMTILHLAVSHKHLEIINFLLYNTGVEVNAVTENGFTAMDILAQSPRDVKDWEIGQSLQNAGAVRATDLPFSMLKKRDTRIEYQTIVGYRKTERKMKQDDWLSKKRDSLMVVASLIATMAFQSGINPPGGLWQDDGSSSSSQNNGTETPHTAGSSIMGYKDQSEYCLYLYYNTIGFIASLSIILLLISGLPFTRRLFMWIITVIVWVAITAMALTYGISIYIFTPKQEEKTAISVNRTAIEVWCGVMALLLVMHTARLAANLFKKLGSSLQAKRRPTQFVYNL